VNDAMLVLSVAGQAAFLAAYLATDRIVRRQRELLDLLLEPHLCACRRFAFPHQDTLHATWGCRVVDAMKREVIP
jgi:hypothetical protein